MRVCLQGHHQFWAGVQGVHDTLKALREGIWAIMLPVLLLGGIYSGYFSPTEAAAVSVLYVLLVELLIRY